MSELAKFLDRNKLVKPSASPAPVAISRPVAPAPVAISRPTSERCYTQGYCSVTGARTFYVCELQRLKTGSMEWTAVDVILADQKTTDNAAVTRSDEIYFNVPPGLTCPSCKVRINGITLNGRTYECSGFVCSCGAHNCYGGHRFVDGDIYTECGKCHAVAVSTGRSWNGTAAAVRETQGRSSVGGSIPRSKST